MSPKVSIIIPAYRSRFFEEALDSALNQTYSNIEIVVGDDCRDNSIELIVNKKFKESRFPLRYNKNLKNLGESPNFEQCLKHSEGEFIKPLYDDDLLGPECVADLIELLVNSPNATLAACHREIIDEYGTIQSREIYNTPLASSDFHTDGVGLAKIIASTRLNIIGEPSSVMFKKNDGLSLLPDIFHLNGRVMTGCADVVMYIKLLLKGDFVYKAKSNCFFRRHSVNHSNSVSVKTQGPYSWEYLRECMEQLAI
jgi:glycosyltransferase involved in cell wall biosynthesis